MPGRLVNAPDTAATYWQLNSSTTPHGHGRDGRNGVRVSGAYDAVTGLLGSRASGPGGSSHQNLIRMGRRRNLVAREERNRAVYEQFTYDSRDRLDYARQVGRSSST
jgi:hypothetical protein